MASIGEVAKLAGVSNSTVSRVINNHPRVARETVQAVRAAMEKLNYTPSENRPGPKPLKHAYGLPASSSATIGFLVLGTSRERSTPAFEDLMRGVSNGAARYNAKLVYHHLPDPSQIPSSVLKTPFDGLLLHGALPPAHVRDQLKEYPTVWLMGNRRRPDWGDQVMPDTYEVGDKAARYLLMRGHRHLAFMNLDQGHWPFRVSSQSFLGVALEAGASCKLLERRRNDDERNYWPQFAVSAAEQLVQEYLKLDPRPTGIYVADDMQLALLQPALQRAGVVLEKGKTEIISCNFEQPYLIGLSPFPAEIDLRVETIGERGVERLLWRMAHRSIVERIVTAIEPQVISHEGQRINWTEVL
jgi:LacI family transcriptional regulator